MAISQVIADLIHDTYALERAGDIAAALRQAQKALEKARTLENPEDLAAAGVCLAYIEYHLGRYGQAQSLAEEALALAAGKVDPAPTRCVSWGIVLMRPAI